MTDLFQTDIQRSAVLSDCGKYRYLLSRTWEEGARPVLFCLLNPSTADALVDDPTVRRCIGFAKSCGHGAVEIVNLFALRSTDPKVMRAAGTAAVGPENDRYIREAAIRCQPVVVAWGAHGIFLLRNRAVLGLLRLSGTTPLCLGRNRDGSPKHPLYLKSDAVLIPFM